MNPFAPYKAAQLGLVPGLDNFEQHGAPTAEERWFGKGGFSVSDTPSSRRAGGTRLPGMYAPQGQSSPLLAGGGGGASSFDLLNGFGGPGSIEDVLRRGPQTPQGNSMRDALSKMGYTPSGGGRMAKRSGEDMFGRATSYEIDGVPEESPSSRGGSSGISLLMRALLEDTKNMREASDRQFKRNNAEIDATRRNLEGSGKELRDQREQGIRGLEGEAGRLDEKGRRMQEEVDPRLDGVERFLKQSGAKVNQNLDRASARVRGGVDDAVRRLHADTDAALREGDAGVRAAEDALAQFQNRTAQDASVVAAGIRRQSQTAMQMARSGMRPDGTPMTPQEQDDAIAGVQFETNAQVQAAITPIFSQYNMQRAQLGLALAQARQTNAQTKLGGAEMRGKAGALQMEAGSRLTDIERARLEGDQLGVQGRLGVVDAQLRSQEGQRMLAQASSALRSTVAQLREAATINVANLEAQGHMNLAQLVQMNPENVVTWFSGLLSLYSAGAAGAR